MSCSALYPQARKLVFELKTQLNYLESSPSNSDGTGGSTESQARENAAGLKSLVDQLDSLVYNENPSNREIWAKKVHQIREEYMLLNTTLEQRCIQFSRSQIEFQERDKLMSRQRHQNGNDIHYLSQEHDSLHRSSRMINELNDLGAATMSNLSTSPPIVHHPCTLMLPVDDQRSRLKGVHRKVLDVASHLGLSGSLLRVIERRETADKWIVYGGIVVVLGFMYICVAYLRG
ncbi:hypothetical protein DYB28_000105 [Aphanomyces astaci]|uniref:Golgi SNAP receptor complex member 2 n=1 Tax=Aphanomyces astaci TaxID=112090 RepID=A0A397AJS7_APHAT|nr:hypothetical protein DYB36_004589 [Aphanomyces astaci]RHY18402.1 hypothetical protein DYB25_002197 [Aphanomyces astaci]RHY46129.1 hypothetical protein DYB30_012190 [Aphanomyces astaci]RHY61442.1 hypothetical protein DYB38_005174 [Aphanomyces astaci]RHY63889.1 hypothetical protein DYB34_004505 [Aphanomyces astaci]